MYAAIFIFIALLWGFSVGYAAAKVRTIEKLQTLLRECEAHIDEREPKIEQLKAAGDQPTPKDWQLLIDITKEQGFDLGMVHAIKKVLHNK